MSIDPTLGLIVIGIFLAAGVIKGTVGIGFPTAAVGMASQVIDPRLAIALVVFPSLIANIWQVWRSGAFIATVKRFWIYLVCIVIVISFVSRQSASVPQDLLILILGLVVVLFSATSLAWAPPFLPERFDRIGQVVSGVLSGILGGLTSIWAPPMVSYLMARRIEKDVFVAASGVMILTGTAPLILGYFGAGTLNGERATLSLALTIPVLAGFAVGERIRRHLDAERFRKVVLWVFLAMGLNLIRRALF